jgi:hypothetical protein
MPTAALSGAIGGSVSHTKLPLSSYATGIARATGAQANELRTVASAHRELCVW